MNVVNLIGRLGRDPETSTSQSGMLIAKFSLATSTKKNGETVTQWHRCVAFGKTAELIQQYITKGQQLGVEGSIQYGQYDKDGITRYTTDIIVNRIHFISSGQGGQQSGGYQQQPQPQNQYQPPGGMPDTDDIPF